MSLKHLVLLLLLVVLASNAHAEDENLLAESLKATIKHAIENEQRAAAEGLVQLSLTEGMEVDQMASSKQLIKALSSQMAVMKAQLNTFRMQMKQLNMQSTKIRTYTVDELMDQLKNGIHMMANSSSEGTTEEGEESPSYLQVKQAIVDAASCDGDDLNCQFKSADAATCALKTATSDAKNYISQLNSKFSLLDVVGKTLSSISMTGNIVAALLYVATKLPYVGTFFSAVNTVFKSIVDGIKSAMDKVSSVLSNGVLKFKSILTSLGTILIGISFLPKLTAMANGGGMTDAFDSLMELLSFNCFPQVLQGLSLDPKSIMNSVKSAVSGYVTAVGEAGSLLKDAANFMTKLLDPLSKALSKIGGVFDALDPVMDFFKPIQNALEKRFTWKMFGKKVLDFSIQDLIDDFNDIMKYIKKIPGLGYVIDKIEDWVKDIFQPFVDYIQKKLHLPSPADLGFPDLPSLDGIPLSDLTKKLTALTDVQNKLSNFFDQLVSTVTGFATKLADKVKIPDAVEDIVDDVSDFVNCNDNTKSTCIVAAVKKIVPGLSLNMTQILAISQALNAMKTDVKNAISNVASGITCVDGFVNVTNPLVYALNAMNGPTCGNPSTTISFCKDITVSDALKSSLTSLVKPFANLITGMIPKSSTSLLQQKSNLRMKSKLLPKSVDWGAIIRFALPLIQYSKLMFASSKNKPILFTFEAKFSIQIEFGVHDLLNARTPFLDVVLSAGTANIQFYPGFNINSARMVYSRYLDTLDMKLASFSWDDAEIDNGIPGACKDDYWKELNWFTDKVDNARWAVTNKYNDPYYQYQKFLGSTRDVVAKLEECTRYGTLKGFVFTGYGTLKGGLNILRGAQSPYFAKRVAQLIDFSPINFAAKWAYNNEFSIPKAILPSGYLGTGGAIRLALSPLPLQYRFDGQHTLFFPYAAFSSKNSLANMDFTQKGKLAYGSSWTMAALGLDPDWYNIIGGVDLQAQYMLRKRLYGDANYL